MLIILIVYPAGVVDPPVINHVEIPTAREGHVTLRSEVKDRIVANLPAWCAGRIARAKIGGESRPIPGKQRRSAKP